MFCDLAGTNLRLHRLRVGFWIEKLDCTLLMIHYYFHALVGVGFEHADSVF
jgi:hypothetical protein